MRRFFRFVLMALVLITVGVVSALTAMRIAIHGRETTVPSFVKLSVPQARHLAETNGLNINLEGEFYSADVPDGRVVSQQPAQGTRVRRGWPVRLALSLGPQRVTIPDVEGESPRAAELNVKQRGLEIDTVAEAHIPDAPADEVIAQSPPPAATAVQSPKISILVAQPPDPPTFVMPNFVGQPLADASNAIEQAGFKLGQVKTDTSAAGTSTKPAANSMSSPTVVIHQSPAAGQRIAMDTPIVLEVGR